MALQSPRKSAITLILGVAIGLASAFIYQNIQDADSSAAEGKAPISAQPAASPDNDSQLTVRPAAPPALGNPKPPDATPQTSLTSLAQLPSGPCRIYGRVTNEAGEPLPDVTLIASATRSALSQDFLDKSFEQQIEDLRLLQANRSLTSTDSAGNYEINGLPAQSYEVYAKSAGRIFEIKDSKLEKRRISPSDFSNSKKSVELNFTGLLSAGLHLKVLDPNGQALNEATVHFLGLYRWNESQRPWRAQEPSLPLRPGLYNFFLTAGERDRFRSATLSIEVSAESASPPIEVRLQESPGLEVTIRSNQDLQNASGLDLVALPFQGECPSDKTITESYDRHIGLQSSLDQPGLYYTSKIQPGHYVVGIVLGQRVIAKTIVDIDQGLTRVELPYNLEDDKFLKILALDPKGRPLTELNVELIRGGPNGTPISAMALRSGDEWLIHVEPPEKAENAQNQAMTLVVFSQFGRKSIDFREGERGPWTIRFDNPARLDVTVSGLRGSGLESSLSVCTLEPGENPQNSYHTKQASFDSEGRATLVSLSPVETDVVLLFGGQWGTLRIAERRLILNAGNNSVSFSTPAASPLRAQASPGVYLSVESAATSGISGDIGQLTARETDKDGFVDFGLVPHGRWRLVKQFGDFVFGAPAMTFEHRGPSCVVFETPPFSVLELSRRLSSDGAPDLQIRDRIVAINSTSFRGEAELKAIVLGIVDDKPIELTIERDGARKTYTITREQWSELNYSVRAIVP